MGDKKPLMDRITEVFSLRTRKSQARLANAFLLVFLIIAIALTVERWSRGEVGVLDLLADIFSPEADQPE